VVCPSMVIKIIGRDQDRENIELYTRLGVKVITQNTPDALRSARLTEPFQIYNRQQELIHMTKRCLEK